MLLTAGRRRRHNRAQWQPPETKIIRLMNDIIYMLISVPAHFFVRIFALHSRTIAATRRAGRQYMCILLKCIACAPFAIFILLLLLCSYLQHACHSMSERNNDNGHSMIARCALAIAAHCRRLCDMRMLVVHIYMWYMTTLAQSKCSQQNNIQLSLV